MSYETELIVELLIPDNIAFTAFTTLKRMGFDIKNLKRADYYKFTLPDKAGFDDFSNRIKKVDILVNANKHKALVKKPLEKIEEDCFVVVVQDVDEPAGLLSTLRERLDFKEIEEMEKGTMWKLFVETKKEAEEISKELLYNRHYQKCEILDKS